MTYIQYKYDDLITHLVPCTWRFRNFSFYPSIAPTGLGRAEDSLETETRFKEKKKVERKKKGGNWRKKKEQEANLRRLKNFR